MKNDPKFKDWILQENKGSHKEFVETVALYKKLQERVICRLFMDAVNNYDGEKIIEIAKAVWFFKGKFDPKNKGVDAIRAQLLIAKVIVVPKGKKWTIRQVAEYIAGGPVETPADGFKRLRETCRDIDFPLVVKRRKRKK